MEFPETIVGVGILGIWVLFRKGWARRVSMAALTTAIVLMAAGLIRLREPGIILEDHRFTMECFAPL